MRAAPRWLAATTLLLWLLVARERSAWAPTLPGARAALAATTALAAALTVALAVLLVVRARAEWRRTRDRWLAIDAALAAALPFRMARAVARQLRAAASLARWVRGRRPRGPLAFPYHAGTPVGLALALAGALAVALAAAAVLAGSGTARVLCIAALSCVLAVPLGAWSALVVHPHTIEGDVLVLRHGVLATARVPLGTIVEVIAEPRRPSRGARSGIRVSHNGGAVAIAVRGRTDVTLRLAAPVVVRGVLETTPSVLTLRAAADDPAALIRALRSRTAAAHASATAPDRAAGPGAPASAPGSRPASSLAGEEER